MVNREIGTTWEYQSRHNNCNTWLLYFRESTKRLHDTT